MHLRPTFQELMALERSSKWPIGGPRERLDEAAGWTLDAVCGTRRVLVQRSQMATFALIATQICDQGSCDLSHRMLKYSAAYLR